MSSLRCAEMKWKWYILLVLALEIIKGNGYKVGKKLFGPDFFRILFSLKGPEGISLRQKYLKEIPRLGVTIHPADLMECPGRVISVMKALGCKNTTNGIEKQLKMLQLLYATNFVPQVLESLLQRNCTMLSGKYIHACRLFVAGTMHERTDNIRLIEGIDQCYQEHVQATNVDLSKR